MHCYRKYHLLGWLAAILLLLPGKHMPDEFLITVTPGETIGGRQLDVACREGTYIIDSIGFLFL